MKLAYRHMEYAEGYLDDAEKAVTDQVRNALWRLSMKEELLALEYWPIEHTGQIPLPGDRWGQDEDEVCEGDENVIECVICGEPTKAPTRSDPVEGLYCTRCK